MSATTAERMALTAEVVMVNDKPMIKVCRGRYLLGYDYNMHQVRSRVERAGYDMADVTIKEREPVRT